MKRSGLISLFLILLVSLGIRIYGLNQQGLIFIDEGTFVYRAKTFELLSHNPQRPMMQPANYADKKIIWVVMLQYVLQWAGDAVVSAQLLSVLAGLITIVLTYMLAKYLYDSKELALLSAALMGLSSIHVFYSRLAMPEMLNLVWVMIMVMCYLRGLHQNAGIKWTVAAGVMMGLCFTTNVFRAGLYPLIFLLLEFGVGVPARLKREKNIYRWPIFMIVSVAAAVGIIAGFWALLKGQGVWLTPYTQLIKSYVGQHSSSGFNGTALVYAMRYLFETEGWHYLGLGLLSLLFIRALRSTLLPICVVGVYVLSWISVDEKAVRALTPVLPFIAMLGAVTIYNCYEKLKGTNRLIFMGAVGLVLVGQWLSVTKVLAFRSDTLPAIEYVKAKDPKARILMSNQPIAIAHDFDFMRYAQLTQEPEAVVRQLNSHGFNYLITDFVKYAVSSNNLPDGRIVMNPFLTAVEAHCPPIKIYPHFNENLQRWMLMEVNQYSHDVKWLDGHISNVTGQLRVYDLNACLTKF